MTELNAQNECYECRHRRNNPGDAHISCEKPDPEMLGNSHGVKNGWFFYPFNFDPVWKRKQCQNFERKEINHD